MFLKKKSSPLNKNQEKKLQGGKKFRRACNSGFNCVYITTHRFDWDFSPNALKCEDLYKEVQTFTLS